MKKLILFGAGRIGRSFIGQLFSRGGYEVVFVDVSQEIIQALNKRNNYRVIIRSDAGNQDLVIENVRGVPATERETIMRELAGTNLMATAVGTANLPAVIEMVSEAIGFRKTNGVHDPLDIIIAENLRDASHYFYNEFAKYLKPESIQLNIGLIETSIGKMVPIMTREESEPDPLMIFAEPYNTLILDKKGFKNARPEIPGLAFKENMAAWVDRKSFIHNLGHATAAYYGFLNYPNKPFLYEVLDDPGIRSFTESVMQQSAAALLKKYPAEFSEMELQDHIEDLIGRFRNKALGDTVFRVGRDIHRKLGPADRLAGAIRMCIGQNTEYNKILYALICGCYFGAGDEGGILFPEDRNFRIYFAKHGLEAILENICKFNRSENPDLFMKSGKLCREISSKFKKTIKTE